MRSYQGARRGGFTMIEVMVSAVIVVILVFVFLPGIGKQLNRGRDARRKTDLDKIKGAWEVYYNDNGCYPPLCALNSCPEVVSEYFKGAVPTDPVTRFPYVYIPYPMGAEGAMPDECQNRRAGFQVFAQLQDVRDTDIAELGCGEEGCAALPETLADPFNGYDKRDYNYGVTEGRAIGGEGTGGAEGGDPYPPGTCATTHTAGYFCFDAAASPTCNKIANADGSGAAFGFEPGDFCEHVEKNPPTGCPYDDSVCTIRP